VTKFLSRIFFASVMSLFLCFALGAVAQDQDQNAPPSAMGGHQGKGGHGMRGTPEQRLERLSKQLNLTDDQKAKIKPILEDEDTKMKALWQDSSTDPQDKRGKFMALHQSSNDQIKALLTDDQQKKFADMQAHMQQHMKNHGGDND